jgi:L-alanine-DL-glutamate epimerase-like enolase superfamily enzyme
MWQELGDAPARPPDRDVTITGVETMALQGNPKPDGDHYEWGIVTLETDAGEYGLGETYRGRAPLDVVERMADTVTGMNPLGPDYVAERLVRTHYTATGGIGRSAIAAIETACWDLKGKILDVPVSELLGGPYRNEVPLYADAEALAGDAVGIDFETEYSPEAYATAAREVVDRGFRALKFDLDVPTPGTAEDRAARRLDDAGIDHKVDLVAAVREAVGDDVDLGMDCHWSYTVETATRLGRALEPFDLAFLEDPVHHDKLEAQARVASAVDVPVLTGENWTTAEAFRRALEGDVLDFAAPDVSMAGGLTELRRIAAVCDTYGVPLAPHNLGSPIATVAGAHLCAAVPTLYSLEFRGGDAPWWEDVVERTGGSGDIVADGTVSIPTGPGLGVSLSEDARDFVVDGDEFVR